MPPERKLVRVSDKPIELGAIATRPPRIALPAGREALLFVTLVVLVAFISIGSHGAFWSKVNLDNLFVSGAITLIPAVGMTAVILTGGIDVSTGSMLGLAAAIGGSCFAAGWGPAAAISVFFASGAGPGLGNAPLVLQGGVPAGDAPLRTLNIYRMPVFIDW